MDAARIGAGWLVTCIIGGAALVIVGLSGHDSALVWLGGIAIAIGLGGIALDVRSAFLQWQRNRHRVGPSVERGSAPDSQIDPPESPVGLNSTIIAGYRRMRMKYFHSPPAPVRRDNLIGLGRDLLEALWQWTREKDDSSARTAFTERFESWRTGVEEYEATYRDTLEVRRLMDEQAELAQLEPAAPPPRWRASLIRQLEIGIDWLNEREVGK